MNIANAHAFELVCCCACVVEVLINAAKPRIKWLEKGEFAVYASIVLGMFCTFAFADCNLASAFGVAEIIPYSGNLITGLFIGFGSGAIYEVLNLAKRFLKTDVQQIIPEIYDDEDDGGVM